jgi:hypothetical protein
MQFRVDSDRGSRCAFTLVVSGCNDWCIFITVHFQRTRKGERERERMNEETKEREELAKTERRGEGSHENIESLYGTIILHFNCPLLRAPLSDRRRTLHGLFRPRSCIMHAKIARKNVTPRRGRGSKGGRGVRAHQLHARCYAPPVIRFTRTTRFVNLVSRMRARARMFRIPFDTRKTGYARRARRVFFKAAFSRPGSGPSLQATRKRCFFACRSLFRLSFFLSLGRSLGLFLRARSLSTARARERPDMKDLSLYDRPLDT